MRIVLLTCLSALIACAAVEESAGGRIRIRYADLPSDMQGALGFPSTTVLEFYAEPHWFTRNSTDALGALRIENGLAIPEDCLVLEWYGESVQFTAVSFVVDHGDDGLRMRAVDVMTVPLGNWRTVWAGDVPLPRDVRSEDLRHRDE